jgi:predicted phage terminase large subunit-like protein
MAKALTVEQEMDLRLCRWKARTDLGYLCRSVLGYTDVDDEAHGPLIAHLQKFPKPTRAQFDENDRLERGEWVYKPIIPFRDLVDKEVIKRRLILDSRGSLKTTINAQAHTIQWIINYPDIAIAIIQSNDQKAADILLEIKKHFTSNQRFRELFPEHCPKGKTLDWGTANRMTTEARGRSITRKEPTIMTGSIEKGSAGYHFDMMKFSDIVEPSNISGNGLEMVKRNYFLMENLLVTSNYWIDVEGTRYHNLDLYGFIIEEMEKLPEEERTWKLYIRGAFVKDTKGQPRKYNAAELRLPNLLGEDGLPISVWPKRLIVKDILVKFKFDPWVASCQMMNFPDTSIGGMAVFPVNEEYPKYISKEDFVRNIRVDSVDLTVDTAETQGSRSNHSVITAGYWSQDGRCYIRKIYRGKWTTDDLCKRIIAAALTHKPGRIIVEETSFVRGLKPTLMRYAQTAGMYFPFVFIKRENQASKEERIEKTLGSWYKKGDIRFVDDFDPGVKEALLQELMDFGSAKSDDILDTIADLFQQKEWFGRTTARKTIETETWEKQVENGGLPSWVLPPSPLENGSHHFDRTGGL